jgi:hypothetical protein
MTEQDPEGYILLVVRHDDSRVVTYRIGVEEVESLTWPDMTYMIFQEEAGATGHLSFYGQAAGPQGWVEPAYLFVPATKYSAASWNVYMLEEMVDVEKNMFKSNSEKDGVV